VARTRARTSTPCLHEHHRSSAPARRSTTCPSWAKCRRSWPASGCACSCRPPSRPRSPSSEAGSATATAARGLGGMTRRGRQPHQVV